MTIAYFGTSWKRRDVRFAHAPCVTLAIVPAIAAAFDDAIARGYGSLDSTAVAKLDGRA